MVGDRVGTKVAEAVNALSLRSCDGTTGFLVGLPEGYKVGHPDGCALGCPVGFRGCPVGTPDG